MEETVGFRSAGSRGERIRFQLGWIFFGLLAQMLYLGLGAAGIRSEGWTGAPLIEFTLLAGASAYLQAWWARRYGLPLPMAEYAILMGVGTLCLMGFSVIAARVGQGRYVMPFFILGFPLFIAAPVRSLAAAGG
ncbi:hypothetical protein BH11ARM2_BH11ARM2_30270 [soil metagenome]